MTGATITLDPAWTGAAGCDVANDGTHDFGYPCSMPSHITVDGLHVEDANTPDGYQGLYYLADPDDFHDGVNKLTLTDNRPFPYAVTRKLSIKGVTTASGWDPRVSPSERIISAVDLST